MLAGIGATEVRGAALASYLLFESSYTCELIELGRRDAFALREDVLKFFGAENAASTESMLAAAVQSA